MGNEICTAGGAVVTVGASVAAAVTLGQIDAVNNAVVECVIFTKNAAAETTVRHVGETVGTAVGTVGLAVASGVTLGQCDALNETVVKLAKHTHTAAGNSFNSALSEGNNLLDGIPVVGHVKGGIHYAFGDKEGGDKAMKNASRTTVVIIGGALGAPGGPVGMAAGGAAAGAAMDGIITGADSYAKGEYAPAGIFQAVTDVVEGKDAQTVIGGVVDILMTPAMDGLTGFQEGLKARRLKAGFTKFVKDKAVPKRIRAKELVKKCKSEFIEAASDPLSYYTDYPEPETESESEPESESESGPESGPESESTSEPESESEGKPEIKPESEPQSESELEHNFGRELDPGLEISRNEKQNSVLENSSLYSRL